MNAVWTWISPVGSTRPVALLRVAFPLLAWACWGTGLHPYDLTEPWLVPLALSFWPATTLMALGLWSRFTTAWAAGTVFLLYHLGGFAYGKRPDDWIHHHHYVLMIAMVLLAFTPCGRSFSLDRWRAAEPEPEVGPLWATRLLGVQLCAVYFWGAYDKSSWLWMSGARMEHYFMRFYWGSSPVPEALLYALQAAGVLTVVLEYSLALGLFVPRAARVLIPLGVALHVLFYLLIPVSTFSLTCIAIYLVFLDPDAVHAAIDRVLRAPQAGAIDTRASL